MNTILKPFRLVRDFLHQIRTRSGARILAFYWAIAIIFISFSILSASNPFTLLIPGMAQEIPGMDWRSKEAMYGIDRASGQPVKTTRLILPSQNPNVQARRVAFAIGSVPSLKEREYIEDSMRLDVLPNLGLALRRAWVIEENGRGRIVLDIRTSTIVNEMDRFLKDRLSDADRRTYYLDGYFQALTYSILEVMDDHESVEYTIDGEPGATIEGMKFDLTRTYTHADLPDD